MSEWQPIETAPKEEVFLYFKAVVSSGGHIDLRPMMLVGRADSFPNRRPTHWQPLPAPPQDPAT